MFIGILFTVIVSLAIGTFGFFIFTAQSRASARFWDRRVFSFALFWLLMGFIWYLIAISDFFAYLGVYAISILLTYIFQIFVGGSLVVVGYFLNTAFFKGSYLRPCLFAYLILYALFLVNLFWFGVHPRSTTFFTNQITSSNQALLVYAIMFIPLWLSALGLFFRTLMYREEFESPRFIFYILASLSLLLLGIAGSLDEAGLVFGWLVSASRLVSLVSAMLAYIGVLALQDPDELVI